MTTKSVIFKNVAYKTLKDLWTHYNNVSEAGTIYSYGIFLKRRREGISIISSLFKGEVAMNRSRKLNDVRSFGKYKEVQIQENIKRIVARNNVKVESVEYVDLSDVIKELRE